MALGSRFKSISILITCQSCPLSSLKVNAMKDSKAERKTSNQPEQQSRPKHEAIFRHYATVPCKFLHVAACLPFILASASSRMKQHVSIPGLLFLVSRQHGQALLTQDRTRPGSFRPQNILRPLFSAARLTSQAWSMSYQTTPNHKPRNAMQCTISSCSQERGAPLIVQFREIHSGGAFSVKLHNPS